MELSEALRDKIRRRAVRAFDGRKQHRITDVTETALQYRISGSLVGKSLRCGPRITTRRDCLGRIYVPKSVEV
jgi:hypothetical protein